MKLRAIRVVGALAVFVVVLSCGGADSIAPPTSAPISGMSDSTLLAGLTVSGPVATGVATPDRIPSGASAAKLASEQLSYVSMVPGTISDGTSSSITNLRTAQRITVTIVDGGFDPQPIPASVGDTLQVSVSRTGKPDALSFLPVIAKAPPKIVRSRPPRGQTDVPLNTVITLVFSEPLAPASVNASSITLSDGASLVAGEVRVPSGPGYTVEFAPSAPLAPATTYTLTVSAAVTNLAGTPVALPGGVSFTTSGSPDAGVVASVTVSPDSAAVMVGTYLQLYATLRDSLGRTTTAPYQFVKWTSSDPAVAYVDPWLGLVRTVGVGTAVIVATGGASVSDTARIIVNGYTTPLGAIVTALCDDYTAKCGLYAVDPDGSNGQYFTNSDDADPVWSPDGTSIAFRSQRGCDRTVTRLCHYDLYVLKVDGSGFANGSAIRTLASGSGLDVGGMSWSPDGSRVVFAGASNLTDWYLNYALYVMNADGSGLRLLVPVPVGGSAEWPDWSPDGRRIAYNVNLSTTSTINVVDADGTNDVRIDTRPASNFDERPHWSPDGKRIAFSREYRLPGAVVPSHAFVMDADGANLTQLTHDPNVGWYPVWSPDGARLAVLGASSPRVASGVRIMGADGTGDRDVGDACCSYGSGLSWRRAPAVAPSRAAQSRARESLPRPTGQLSTDGARP